MTDRFRVEDLLGQGGMGEVYRAWDTVLARPVALKRIRRDRREDASVTGRFLREARIAAALRHPNIVTVFDLGVEDDDAYIVMELLEGQPLRDAMAEPLRPLSEKLGWLREIGSALAAAHAAGVVHRDIKPSNVVVGREGHVKVLDFGLAKKFGLAPLDGSTTGPMSFHSEVGVVVGTPLYMAPEQFRGEDGDPGVDQYAWGAVGFELVCGERWSPALRDVSGVGSPDILRVLRRATEPHRDSRFRSMADALTSLDAALGLTPGRYPREADTQVAGSGPPANDGPPRGLSTWAAALAGAGATLALAGALLLGVVWGRRSNGNVESNRVDFETGAAAIAASSAPGVASSGSPASAASSQSPSVVAGKSSASPAAPSGAPPRVRYGGALEPHVASGILLKDCPGCDVQAFVDQIRASRSIFAPCFSAALYEPPMHADPKFMIAVSADGSFGAVSQWHPQPPHSKLGACIARAIKSVPLIKNGGGPGSVEIDFAAPCAQAYKDGHALFDRCGN